MRDIFGHARLRAEQEPVGDRETRLGELAELVAAVDDEAAREAWAEGAACSLDAAGVAAVDGRAGLDLECDDSVLMLEEQVDLEAGRGPQERR